jgi:hypothetical protein
MTSIYSPRIFISSFQHSATVTLQNLYTLLQYLSQQASTNARDLPTASAVMSPTQTLTIPANEQATSSTATAKGKGKARRRDSGPDTSIPTFKSTPSNAKLMDVPPETAYQRLAKESLYYHRLDCQYSLFRRIENKDWKSKPVFRDGDEEGNCFDDCRATTREEQRERPERTRWNDPTYGQSLSYTLSYISYVCLAEAYEALGARMVEGLTSSSQEFLANITLRFVRRRNPERRARPVGSRFRLDLRSAAKRQRTR